MTYRDSIDALDEAIRTAFDSAPLERILMAKAILPDDPGVKSNIDISSAITKLIQDTGCYVERSASDIVILINSLTTALEYPRDNNGRIFLFGMRRDSVDNYESVREQMWDSLNNPAYFEERYRKIWAVKIEIRHGGKTAKSEAEISVKEILTHLGFELYMLTHQ